MNTRRLIGIAVFFILECHTIEGATTSLHAINSTEDYWNTTGINVTFTPTTTDSVDSTQDATAYSDTTDEPQPTSPPCVGQVCNTTFPCVEDQFIDNNDSLDDSICELHSNICRCRVKCASGQYGYRHECTCPGGRSIKFGICRNCTKDTDDPACREPTNANLIIIISASSAGVVLIVIFIVVVCVCCRKRRPRDGGVGRTSRPPSIPRPHPPSIEEIDGNTGIQAGPRVIATYENLNPIDKKLSEKIADGHEKIFRYVPDPVAAIKEKINTNRPGTALPELPVSTARGQLQPITTRPPATAPVPPPYQDEAVEIYGNDEVIDRIAGRLPPPVPHDNGDQSDQSSRASKTYVNYNELQKIMKAAASGSTQLAETGGGYTNHAFRAGDTHHGRHGDKHGVKNDDAPDSDSTDSYENMATAGVMGYQNPVFSESAIEEPEYQNFSELKLDTLK